jgi:hypothetical protein
MSRSTRKKQKEKIQKQKNLQRKIWNRTPTTKRIANSEVQFKDGTAVQNNCNYQHTHSTPDSTSSSEEPKRQ